MNRLCGIARKKTRVIVGLMSGTSHDGVDAVVARVAGNGPKCRVEILGQSRLGYPRALRERVAAAFNGDTALVCALNFELGEFFAKAALKGIAEAGLTPGEVGVIGSHGQTIYHMPPSLTPRPLRGEGQGVRVPGSTLQIAEGAVIAARTGVLTVSDFRPADIAAGGQGAPLVPYADWVLFRKKGRITALQNIGGISNVTVVTEDMGGVRGFDTGPGCSLLDETVRILSGGKQRYDKDGKMGRSGGLLPDLLPELLNHPYFKKKPPKSTGRELFGREMAQTVINKAKGAKAEDIVCTLTHLTARSIYNAYRDFVFPVTRVDTVALAGGGARNKFLFELIRGLFNNHPHPLSLSPQGRGKSGLDSRLRANDVSFLPSPFKGRGAGGEGYAPDVILIDDLGVPAEAREALCFAILANETVSGLPSNVPAVTGAGRPAVLGKVSF